MARMTYGSYIDITGKRYGMLTVLEFSHFGKQSSKRSGRRTYWLCQCDCGNEVIRRKDTLTTKRNPPTIYISCGCMKQAVVSERLRNEHKQGINPTKKGDEHWTRKDPERARKIALNNLGDYVKPKNNRSKEK